MGSLRIVAPVILALELALSACADGGDTTGQTGPIVPTDGRPIDLATTAKACKPPKTHPFGTILGTTPASGPWAVAVRDDGLAYFTELFNNRVGITNTATRQVTGFIQTGSLPTGIAFSPDGDRAYTANQGDNTVTVIDVATAQPIASIVSNASPFSVEVSPDGSLIYVGNNDNTILMVDTQTLQILKTLSVGFATNAFAVHPGGRIVYASQFVSGSVTEIDLFTGTILRTFNLGGYTQGLAINKKGTHLYVANEGGYLSDIDLLSGQVGPQIPLTGGVAFGVGVTPDDKEAWITFPLSGKLQIFNLVSRKIRGTLDVGGEPRRIAFSDQGNIGAVTNYSGGYITFVK